MRGKLLFKRLVFGKLVEMPGELIDTGEAIQEPVKIETNTINRSYKVIFALAAKNANIDAESNFSFAAPQ